VFSSGAKQAVNETVQQVIPINQTVFVTETVQQVIPITQTVVVTETVQQVVPINQTVYVTETIQEVVPVNQTIFVTETVQQFVPVTKTVLVTETVLVTRLVEQIVPIKEVIRVTQTVRVGPPAPIFIEPVTNTTPISGTEGRAPRLPFVANWTALSPTYWEQTPLPVSGVAMYYNPFVMDGVLRYRQNNGNIDACPECIGYIALLRAGDLNRRVWIQLADGSYEGPFQVTDVAARHDIPSLLRRGWVVDVDWGTARRWGMRGGVPVTILPDPPDLMNEMIAMN
jgi:hypothetical protein